MRSTTFSSFAFLASLLAREALGVPVQKRELVIEDVIVTEIATVTLESDGDLVTGAAFPIGTATIPRVADSAVVTSADLDAPVRDKAPLSVSEGGQVFAEIPTTSPEPSSVASVAPTVAPAPEPTTVAPVAVPTTVAPLPEPSTVAPVVVPEPITVAPVVVPKPTTFATIVAAPSTSAAAVPVSTSAPISSGGSSTAGSKRGLDYNDASLLEGFVTAGSKVSWCYNWGSTPGGDVPSSLEYVAMLWGLGDHVNGWTEAAQNAINAGGKHLLGFNEPDLGAQSNISPGDAAIGWKANMEQFAGKAKLGAPAVTNGGGAMGVSWLSSFLDECDGCTIDFIPFHWYDSASNFAYFKNHIEDVRAVSGGRPLWITEFGASGSTDEQAAFITQAVEYLDGLDYVERYSYFMAGDGYLVTGSTPNALGRAFAGIS